MFADMWRDQDRSGFDEAIYWLELLIKYGSFEHLQINDHELNMLQYFSVDVIFVYILLAILLLMMFIKTFVLCVSRTSMKLHSRVSRRGDIRNVSVLVTLSLKINNRDFEGSLWIAVFGLG